MRIGVDTGGTFTDFVFWDGERLGTRKVRSTPDDPARAIREGLGELVAEEIVHGSTVATNALLEGKGARTALVTTAGFEDLLVIGRQNRPRLYDLFAPPRTRLVPAEWTHGAPERMLHDGTVEQALDGQWARGLARRLKDAGVESVAVCLLHSYANGAHEEALGRELEGFFVSLSHKLLPEYREYERASTTVVNAYVTPHMAGYLRRLEKALGGIRLRVLQSNGGSIAAETAARSAVHTILSGPAGGVLGAAAVARAAGIERFISFDMGGTSTDVSLYDGGFSYTTESVLGDFPVRLPMLDIHSVGAGGGSIAWVDSAGALRVGPQSAGADPGPVCYGRGEEITVTDANLLLGRIDPKKFLSGRMKLEVERARHYLREFSRRMQSGERELAEAIVRVANSNMERAIRAVSIERGYDPRDFALLTFGGAGAQHACELAQALEIGTVLVPRHAGVLSALGMLAADCVRDYSQSALNRRAEEAFTEMESRAQQDFAAEGFREVACERLVDLRYRGQSFEITLPWAERESFDEAHRRLYGYAHRGREVETVTARLRARAALEKVDLDAPSEEENFFSVYVPEGWKARKDAAGNTVLKR